MPLRSPNNAANTDVQVMSSIKTVCLGIPPNTALALNSTDGTGLAQTYVQREYDMLNNGVFPAVLIQAGTQGFTRMSNATYAGQFTAVLDYYDRYDETNSEFDDIRAALALDLERMKSNLESNDSLAVGGAAHAVSLLKSTLSPYAGILRDYNGIKLVYRRLMLVYNTLDYDATS